MPNWLSFNSQTLEIKGKPTDQSYGLNNLTLVASDSLNEIKINFGLIIERSLEAKIGAKIVMVNTDNNLVSSSKNISDFFIGNDYNNNIQFEGDGIRSSKSFSALNSYTKDLINIFGKIRSFDAFNGGNGYDILNLTKDSDSLFLDDSYSLNPTKNGVCLAGIEEINVGNGDDVIDLSSSKYVYGKIIINGENGNDVIWGNDGNNQIKGGNGDDYLSVDNGNDIIKGYNGNDSISWWQRC